MLPYIVCWSSYSFLTRFLLTLKALALIYPRRNIHKRRATENGYFYLCRHQNERGPGYRKVRGVSCGTWQPRYFCLEAAMNESQQAQCRAHLDKIMLIGNYLDALGTLEEEQLKCICSPYAFEAAARLLRESERELYGCLDEDSDEERQAKLSKTPEEKAKEERFQADMERSSKAFTAITPLLSSDPDFFIQLAEAFEKDPESIRARLHPYATRHTEKGRCSS